MILLRRLLLMAPILFGVMTVTFFVTRVLPGDPSYSIAGPFASQDVLESIRQRFGFNGPLWQQYVSYLNNAIHLDFGTSLRTGNAVTHDFAQKLPATLELIIFSLALALLVGVPAGALAARQRGRAGDMAVRVGSFVILSVPEFWLALILLYNFFFILRWAPPPDGQLSLEDPVPSHLTGAAVIDSVLTGNLGALKASLAHAALPVITLGVVYSAPIARLMRSSMLEVLEGDYIRFGRACGLPTFTLWRYAVRASLPPVVTFVGIIFTLLIGGAVLVETIFSWDGAAQYAASAVVQNDYAAIQAFVLVSGTMSVVVFLVVDLLYVAIDPRVRL